MRRFAARYVNIKVNITDCEWLTTREGTTRRLRYDERLEARRAFHGALSTDCELAGNKIIFGAGGVKY
jgi:hypothetical protein